MTLGIKVRIFTVACHLSIVTHNGSDRYRRSHSTHAQNIPRTPLDYGAITQEMCETTYLLLFIGICTDLARSVSVCA